MLQKSRCFENCLGDWSGWIDNDVSRWLSVWRDISNTSQKALWKTWRQQTDWTTKQRDTSKQRFASCHLPGTPSRFWLLATHHSRTWITQRLKKIWLYWQDPMLSKLVRTLYQCCLEDRIDWDDDCDPRSLQNPWPFAMSEKWPKCTVFTWQNLAIFSPLEVARRGCKHQAHSSDAVQIRVRPPSWTSMISSGRQTSSDGRANSTRRAADEWNACSMCDHSADDGRCFHQSGRVFSPGSRFAWVFAKKTTEGKGTTNRAHHQSQETSAKGQYPNHACNKYYLLGIFCISPQFRRVRRLCRQWAPLHNSNMGSGIGLVGVWW